MGVMANQNGFRDFIKKSMETTLFLEKMNQFLDDGLTTKIVKIVVIEIGGTTQSRFPTSTSTTQMSGTRQTWSKVKKNELDDTFISPSRSRYQGYFVDNPAVSGD